MVDDCVLCVVCIVFVFVFIGICVWFTSSVILIENEHPNRENTADLTSSCTPTYK